MRFINVLLTYLLTYILIAYAVPLASVRCFTYFIFFFLLISREQWYRYNVV